MNQSIFMIVIIVVMIGFMWWQSRKQKQRQQQTVDWRTSLQPGSEVATVSGLLGVVKEVDLDHDQIIIDSEGSLSRWRIQAITKPPVVPAYVSDDEVDENGNPLPSAETDDAEASAESADSAASVDSVDSVEATEASDADETAASEKDDAAPSGPIDSEK
jgi:preprotein translocase subunit YajC